MSEFVATGNASVDMKLAETWVQVMRERGCCFHLVMSINSDVVLSNIDRAIFQALYPYIMRAVVADDDAWAHALTGSEATLMPDAEPGVEMPANLDTPTTDAVATLRTRLKPGVQYEMLDHSDGMTEQQAGIRTVTGTGTAGSRAVFADGRAAWLPLDDCGPAHLAECVVSDRGFRLVYEANGQRTVLSYAWR